MEWSVVSYKSVYVYVWLGVLELESGDIEGLEIGTISWGSMRHTYLTVRVAFRRSRTVE